MRFVAVLIALWLFCTSCEKAIDIQTGTGESSLVVDGTIENGLPPLLFLSNSLDYFSAISPQILAASQVRNAIVVLNDGITDYTLKEYTQPLGNGITIRYYTVDSSAAGPLLVGKQGTTYTLKVKVDGQQYNSQTSIPTLNKTLDTLWWKPAPGENKDNKVVVMTRVSDPPGFGNYIRYFTSVNGGPYLPGANSVFDDQIVDGTTYDIQVDQGINRNDPPKFEEYGFFTKGDTVTVKFCNIDKATFDYWRTLEFSYQSVGNPFSTPTTVSGNVSNGALGAFCGYAVQYKTLIIPK